MSMLNGPSWAPSVRTKRGWVHAETGELLIALGDTTYALAITSSTGAVISDVKFERNRFRYVSGDILKLQVFFSKPVKVTGAPFVILDIDGTPTTLAYVARTDFDTTLGQSVLMFEHTVTDSDVSAAGDVALTGTSAVRASRTIGAGNAGIVYTAVTPGTGGNSITVAYVNPGTESAALSVGVIGNAITVNLATNDEVHAALAIGTGNAGITYTAVDDGVAGNSITIRYLNPGTESAALSVGVIGSAITVNCATGQATNALLAVGLLDAGITYTAVVGGTVGNAITIAYVNPGTHQSPLTVGVVGSAITVNLATGNATLASREILAGDAGIDYVAVVGGTVGNAITIAYVDPEDTNQSLGVVVVGSAITVNLATDGAGAITSTAAQIATALGLSEPASELVNPALIGTGGDVVTATGPTTLANGADDAAANSTATEVLAAIESEAPADALVSGVQIGTGGDPVVAIAATNLASGADDAAITSTATQVLAAIESEGAAAALVTGAQIGTGGSAVVAAALANLAGGAAVAITSTALLVRAAIIASGPASALVTTAQAGTGASAVVAVGGTALQNGAAAVAGINVNGGTILTAGAPVRATRSFGSVNAIVTFSDRDGGTDGNSLTVTLVDPSANNRTLSHTYVPGGALVLSLATGSGGAITSTPATIKAYVEANIELNKQFVVGFGAGSGVSAVIAATVQSLAGGLNADVTAATLTFGDEAPDLTAVAIN